MSANKTLLLMGITLLTVPTIIVLVVLYYLNESPSISLIKDEWICTNTHKREHIIYVKNGNVLLPLRTKNEVCDQWDRKVKTD